jgi:hypothetical protein
MGFCFLTEMKTKVYNVAGWQCLEYITPASAVNQAGCAAAVREGDISPTLRLQEIAEYGADARCGNRQQLMRYPSPIHRRVAWLKYALAGGMAGAEIRHGINVFLRGALWNLGSDGHTILVREQAVFEARHIAGVAILNLWLS